MEESYNETDTSGPLTDYDNSEFMFEPVNSKRDYSYDNSPLLFRNKKTPEKVGNETDFTLDQTPVLPRLTEEGTISDEYEFVNDENDESFRRSGKEQQKKNHRVSKKKVFNLK